MDCKCMDRMPAKKSTDEFVKAAQEVHGDRYDYSRVDYQCTRIPVAIICRVHGEFRQQPDSHLKKKGCPDCGGRRKLTAIEFRRRANDVHGDLYEYGRSEFQGVDRKVVIICKKHGEYSMQPSEHLRGWGCRVCQLEDRKPRLQSEWLEKARKRHGKRYNYEKAHFVDSRDKITITCKKHGDFRQAAAHHLKGRGCPRCICRVSRPSIEWLEAMAALDKTHIQHGGNGGEAWLEGTRLHPDGYSAELNKVYEFLGNYYHGNPRRYDPETTNTKVKKTMGELYRETAKRRETIEALGYNYEEIWEDELEAAKGLLTLSKPRSSSNSEAARTLLEISNDTCHIKF